MSDFLDSMAASSAERVMPDLSGEARAPVVPLSLNGFDIIAEIKSRSPSAGRLAGDTFNRVAQARCYAESGACAISVLTEPERFDGALAHLEEVVDAVPGTPVMRKDFLVHTWQVREARLAGASGVLLIAAILDDESLIAMLNEAAECALFVLVEAFDEQDLTRIQAAMTTDVAQSMMADGQLLVGVNSRNLRTLGIDASRFAKLAPMMPSGIAVAESGLHHAADIASVAQAGYALALIGSALMQAEDPGQQIRAFLDVGRQQVAA